MPSDVLITPATSKIDFTDGANSTKKLSISGTAFSFNSNLNVLSSTSLSSAFKAEGVNGTLFEVTDDLSNSLMSVNTIGGLPVFEVFANNSIIGGQYGANDFVISGNKIGLGYANPVNKLSVSGSVSIGSSYNVAAPSNGLIVQGNVGIGTVSPSARLTIVDNTNGGIINLVGRTSDDTAAVNFRVTSDASTYAYISPDTNEFRLYHNDGFMSFYPGGTEKWRITAAGILESNGLQTIRTNTGNLTLATALGNGHILLSPHGTGNVGIGNATPKQLLHINGNILLDGLDNGYTQPATRGIGYGGNSGGVSGNGFSGMDVQSVNAPAPNDGNYSQNLRFWTHHYGLGTGGTPRMVIQYNGNVGIGTITPAYKLDVNGTTRFGGIVYNEAVQTDDFNYFNLQPYIESETTNNVLPFFGTAPTFVTLTNTTAPFSKVMSFSAYAEAALADYIPVQAGETIYGEIWVFRSTGASGTAGGFYCGVARYDKDKKMIDGNLGLTYFIASNYTVPSTSTWTKYSGVTTLPLTHTPVASSDGGPARYVRPYIIVNNPSGTILTYITGWKIRKVELTRDSGIVSINGSVGVGTISPNEKLSVYPGITGGIALQAGDGTTRSYYFIDNTNPTYSTGIRTNNYYLDFDSSGASQNAIRFYTGTSTIGTGTERMRIASNGNIGIGLVTSPNHLLHLSTVSNDVSIGLYSTNANANARNWLISTNEIAYGDFNIKQSNAIGGNPRSAGTSRFYIQNDGNVGIGGAISPIGKLQLGADYANDGYGGYNVYVKSTTAGTLSSYDPRVENTSIFSLLITDSSSTTTGPDKIGLVLHNNNATAGAFSPMLLFTKKESGSTPYKATMAGIYARSPLGTGDTDSWIDGELIFATAGAASEGIKQRMVINKEGYVGIGITIPTAKLDVLGVRLGRDFSIANRATVRLDSNGTTYPSDVLFGHTAAANQDGWTSVYWSLSSRADANSNRFYFYRGGGNPAPNNSEAVIMSFDPNLNVGVGFEAPTNRLSIGGSVSIGSNYNTAATTNGLIVEGNVGIGITGPTAKLDVTGSATSGYSLLLRSGDTYNQTDSVQIAFGYANTTNYRHSIRTRHWPGIPVSGVVGNNIDFYVWKRGTDAAADLGTQFVMTMQGDGAVGIGVTNPVSANKLSVSGSVSVGSNYNIAAPTNGLIVEGDIGVGITSPLAKLHVNSTTSGATLLRADGTNGTLFSVVDDLSDSLMSVNNSAGLPVLEVFADDRVVAGQYGANDFVLINNKLGLGTNSPAYKLDVRGSTVNARVGLMEFGTWPLDTTYIYLQNNTLSLIGQNYGFLQSSTGETFVNAAPNQTLHFRIGNSEKWAVLSTGVLQSDGLQTIRTSTGNLTLATNGTNGHIILSPHGTGNVGIGTTSPAYKLDINSANDDALRIRNGAGGANNGLALCIGSGSPWLDITEGVEFRIKGNTYANLGTWNSGNNTKLLINSSGNIGIGTTSPVGKLTVQGNIEVNYNSTTADSFVRRSFLTPHAVINRGANIAFGIVDGGGLAGMTVYDTAAAVGAFNAQFIGFNTHEGGVSTDERMRITSTGLVGIGTVSPETKLHALVIPATNATVDDVLKLTSKFPSVSNAASAVVGSGPAIVFSGGIGDNQTRDRARIVAVYEGSNVSGLAFHTQNTADIITEKVRFQNNGNVGIGTPIPTARLDVRPNTPIAAYQGTVPYQTTTAAILSPVMAAASVDTYTSILQLVSVRQALVAGRYAHGYLGFSTVDNSNINGILDAGRISIKNDDGIGSLSATSMGFWTNTGGSASNPATERVRIASDGNVGIGTVSPQKRLDAVSSSNDFVTVGAATMGNGSWCGIHFGYREDNNLYRKSAIVFERTDLTEGNAQGKVHILNGPQAGNASATLANSRLTINEAGNVGLGTTSPGAPLTIYKASNPWIRVNGGGAFSYIQMDDGTSYGYLFKNTSSDTTNGALAGAMYTYTDSNKAFQHIHSGTPLFTILSGGSVGIGTVSPLEKLHVLGNIHIQSESDSLGGGGLYLGISNSRNIAIRQTSTNKNFAVDTYNASESWQNRITILNSGGNVGIGKTTPNAKLNVLSTSSLSSVFKTEGVNGTLFEVTDDLSNSLMSVNTIGGLPVFEVFANNSIIAGQYGQNDFVISGNKVGIGTASPIYKLDVNGTGRFSGDLTVLNLIGSYSNTSVYSSSNAEFTTPSRGIRAQSSSIQFTNSYAIAPYYTYRSTGDWPVPYGIGWGTGGESSGIFQRYAANGYSFGDMVFYTGNDGYGAFSFRRHTWEGNASLAATSGQLNVELFRVDWAGNASLLGTLTANVTGNLTGTAATATARNINGTSFDHSANITTATWGTARTLTIGSMGKSVDGSAAVAWTLAEIGAVPVAGGTMSGVLTTYTPGVQTSVTGLSAFNAGINVGERNVGSVPGFVPGYGQTTLYTSGYRSHMILGSYRTASSWGGGPFIAWGGNDGYATEYWLFNQGGAITHSGGKTMAYTDGANASGSWPISITGSSASAGSATTAAGLSATLAVASGGTGATAAAAARTNLGATTLGANLFTLANVAAISFPRINADNTVSSLDAAAFRTAIGAGTGGGSGTVTGVTASAPLASSEGTAPNISLSGAVALANGGSGQTSAQAAMNAFAGAVTNTQYLRGNGTNVVMSAIQVIDVPILNQNTTGSSASCSGTAATANALNTANNYTVAQMTVSTSATPSSYVIHTGTSPSAIRLLAYTDSTYIQSGTSTSSSSADLVFSSMQAGAEWMRIKGATGRLGIGTSTPAYLLDVNGTIHYTTLTASSDGRFKKNVQVISNPLDKLSSIRGVRFEWNEFINDRRNGYELNKPTFGVIAQELEEVFPELITLWKLSDDCTDARSVNYEKIIPILIEAVKELNNKNKLLESRLLILENK